MTAGAHRAADPGDGPTVHVQRPMHAAPLRPPAVDTPTGVVRAALVGVVVDLEHTRRGAHRRRLAPETTVALWMAGGVVLMLAPLAWLIWPLL